MVIAPKLKIYGVVLGIFVLGAGAGGAAGYAMASKRLAEAFREDRPGLGDVRRFEALSRELDLTRDQRQRVRVIMDRHRDENRVLTRAMVERCGDDLQDLPKRRRRDPRRAEPENQKPQRADGQRGKRFHSASRTTPSQIQGMTALVTGGKPRQCVLDPPGLLRCCCLRRAAARPTLHSAQPRRRPRPPP